MMIAIVSDCPRVTGAQRQPSFTLPGVHGGDQGRLLGRGDELDLWAGSWRRSRNLSDRRKLRKEPAYLRQGGRRVPMGSQEGEGFSVAHAWRKGVSWSRSGRTGYNQNRGWKRSWDSMCRQWTREDYGIFSRTQAGLGFRKTPQLAVWKRD